MTHKKNITVSTYLIKSIILLTMWADKIVLSSEWHFRICVAEPTIDRYIKIRSAKKLQINIRT